MLLFDEADSLFTSRVKVENSVDRFANMETNLLLQEIERFEGVIILTTNHEKNIDEAFQRRIQFKVSFPFPDAEQRARIWKTLVPPECPVDENMDYDLLGESYELSGGYIKNAILKAAYRAAIEEKVMEWTIGCSRGMKRRKIFQSIVRDNGSPCLVFGSDSFLGAEGLGNQAQLLSSMQIIPDSLRWCRKCRDWFR